MLADVLEAMGQFDKAAGALTSAAALEPSDALSARLDIVRARAAFEAMPPEFRTIEQATTVTRAQLAALIGTRLDALLKRAPRQNSAVITDTRANWAAQWILPVARAGFMEVYPNHTFQPSATVRRGDLATAVSRILSAIAVENPKLGASWRTAKRKFPDLSPGTPELSRGRDGGRGRRDGAGRGGRVPVVDAGHGWRSSGGRRPPRRPGRPPAMMKNLTAANQLTILRMLLIPAFVILLMYGYRGWALLTFLTAGATDMLDGLIARYTGQNTELGAWLDPMADKLLLVTMFVVLTLPEIGSANRLPLWFTVLVISRDVAIVGTVAVFNLAVGPRTFRPSIFGKVCDCHLHRHRGRHAVFQLSRPAIANRDRRSSTPRS